MGHKDIRTRHLDLHARLYLGIYVQQVLNDSFHSTL